MTKWLVTSRPGHRCLSRKAGASEMPVTHWVEAQPAPRPAADRGSVPRLYALPRRAVRTPARIVGPRNRTALAGNRVEPLPETRQPRVWLRDRFARAHACTTRATRQSCACGGSHTGD